MVYDVWVRSVEFLSMTERDYRFPGGPQIQLTDESEVIRLPQRARGGKLGGRLGFKRVSVRDR